MIEVLIKKGLNISLEQDLLAVSPKDLITDDLRIFIRKNKPKLIVELKKQKLEILLSKDKQLKEQFEFEIAERIAIMVFDGELTESNAVEAAKENIFDIWFSLFENLS